MRSSESSLEFQRLYTPTAFREERILWRAVIQLNVIRSIRTILDALTAMPTPHASPHGSPRIHARSLSVRRRRPSNPLAPSAAAFALTGPSSTDHARADSGPESDPDSEFEISGGGPSDPSSFTFVSSPLDALKARLLPLRHIEALLIAKLVPPNEDEATQLAGPSHSMYPSGSNGTSLRTQEVFIRPGNRWKGALAKARVYGGVDQERVSSSGNGRPLSAGNLGLETPDEAQQVLNSCRKDMMQLWNDQGVRDFLRRKKIRLEEDPGLSVLF